MKAQNCCQKAQTSLVAGFVKHRFRIVLAFVLVLVAVFATANWAEAKTIKPVESIEIRQRVFEADAALVDELIPTAQRKSGVQPNAKRIRDKHATVEQASRVTVSQLAEISPATLKKLLDRLPENPGLLINDTRSVSDVFWFPGMADGWTYGRDDGKLTVIGSGVDFLGYRHSRNHDEIRIEMNVRHSVGPTFAISSALKRVDLWSKILYQGTSPQNGALAFLVPFSRPDESARYLVLAFETLDSKTINAELQKQPEDIGRIVAIARPDQSLYRWWNINGEPVKADRSWVQGLASATLAVLIEKSGKERLNVDTTIPNLVESFGRGSLSSSNYRGQDGAEREVVYFNDNQAGLLRDYLDEGGQVSVQLFRGSGPWKEIAEVKEGQTLQTNGGTFRLVEVKDFTSRRSLLEFSYDFGPDCEISLVAVDKKGKRSEPPSGFCSGYFQPGEKSDIVAVFMGKKDIARYIVLKRARVAKIYEGIPVRHRTNGENFSLKIRHEPVGESGNGK